MPEANALQQLLALAGLQQQKRGPVDEPLAGQDFGPVGDDAVARWTQDRVMASLDPDGALKLTPDEARIAIDMYPGGTRDVYTRLAGGSVEDRSGLLQVLRSNVDQFRASGQRAISAASQPAAATGGRMGDLERSSTWSDARNVSPRRRDREMGE